MINVYVLNPYPPVLEMGLFSSQSAIAAACCRGNFGSVTLLAKITASTSDTTHTSQMRALAHTNTQGFYLCYSRDKVLQHRASIFVIPEPKFCGTGLLSFLFTSPKFCNKGLLSSLFTSRSFVASPSDIIIFSRKLIST